MRQGSITVDEYYKKMEILMICADLKEKGKPLMGHFIVGLNPEISKIVELQNYLKRGDLVDIAIKIESQLKVRRLGGRCYQAQKPMHPRENLIQ